MMRPELLNRIDKIIVFRALTTKNVLKILDLQLDELRARLIKHGIGLEISSAAKHYLLKAGYDAHNGARPLRRLLQETVEDHVAHQLLDRKYGKGDIVQISLKNKQLTYNVVAE